MSDLFVPQDVRGVVFRGGTWLVLRHGQFEGEIRLAGEIEIVARRHVVLTYLPDIQDTVKEDFGFAGYEMTIRGEIMTLEAQKELFGFTLPFGGEVITDVLQVKRLLRLFRLQRGSVLDIEDEQGTMAEMGITKVVLLQARVRSQKGIWTYDLSTSPVLHDGTIAEVFG